nr:integrase, catalytic region, zinc finger, CCHC-type, peptidase aspartic, catalytic [Tanacetum cinerariifolium]
MYLHKVKECDCLAQKISKQTESVSNKNNTVCNEKASNVFQKEREQYFEIQDLKAQMQDKNIANCELKKLVEKGKGKSMDTQLDRPYVVRQPTTQRIPKPLVLAKKAVSNTNVLRPGMYRIDNRIAHTRAPQLTQTVRNTNLRVSTSIGVNHKPNVSRPHLKSNQSRDKVLPNNSQVKAKDTQVEVHPRIPSVSNKLKSVTACKDSLHSRTLNANVVCATCNKCLADSNHFACVTKMLNDIVQLILFIIDSGCTKHMTGNLKLLCNFVEKFLGTVRFGNDQFAPILGYGDLVQGNVTINRVYYVEGLNHNLFSVDYDNPDHVPQRQDVYSSADADVPPQQELDMLFGPLYDEFFNSGTNPSTSIPSTSAPSTHINMHAEENNNDQPEEGEHIPDDEFTNPFCASTQEVAESSSQNIGNSNDPTFNQPQVSEYRWTKDHPLEQVHGNPSRPV